MSRGRLAQLTSRRSTELARLRREALPGAVACGLVAVSGL